MNTAPTARRIAALACLTLGAAQAQQPQQPPAENIEKLKQFKVATTDLNIPVVPQEGRNAEAIKANLKRVKSWDQIIAEAERRAG